MAYAAILSLRQTLEDLLCFPCVLLQIKRLQARRFIDKVGKIFTGTSTNWRTGGTEFVQSIADAANTVEEFIQSKCCCTKDILKITEKFFSTYHRKSGGFEEVAGVLDEVPNILREISLFQVELKKFSCWLQEDGISAARKLLFAGDNLKKATNFCEEVIVQIILLYQDLAPLPALLKDSADNCGDHEIMRFGELEQCIGNVAYRARDFLEDSMKDHSFESKVKSWVGPRTTAFDRKRSLEIVFMATFDGEYGIRHCLLQTLEEISSITTEIKRISCKTLASKAEISSRTTEIKRISCKTLASKAEISSITTKIKRVPCKTLATKALQLGKNLIKPSVEHSSDRENVVVGLDEDLMRILDRLTRLPSGLEIETIVGMGGVGKTTLARKVFEHTFIAYHFYCRAWITVSQVYQVRELLLGILSSVTQVTDELHMKTNEQLAEALYRSLKGRRYLIVMDDLWNGKAWDVVRRSFPDDKNGSRIVITSRLMTVALHVNPKGRPHCMSLLSVDESWELLRKKVLGEESYPPELVDFGKLIAKRCQGLPLAIVVIAGILSKNTRTSDFWRKIADSFSSFVNTDPEQCRDILAVSYNHLPHHLKRCFLYMGAFPEDCEIEVQKLIRLWLAEGFLYSVSSKSPEQVGEDYLEDLISRSLVLVGKRSFSGKIKTCRLHDLLRKLSLREARKDRFMYVIENQFTEFSRDIKKQRRLCVHSDFYGDIRLLPSHAQSFLCFSVGFGVVSDIFYSYLRFELLRVLDIVFLHFDTFPTQIVEITNLRYLALTATYDLPASLSNLRNLQTFIVHGPWRNSSSRGSPTMLLKYWEMPSLRHLHYSVSTYFPNPSLASNDHPLGRLQTLSTLRFVSCTKEILVNLPHLKKLGICETEEDFTDVKSTTYLNNLVYLSQLEELKCSFSKRRRVNQLPTWDAFPSNLKKLTISWGNLPWKDMTSLAMLPKLEILRLSNFAFQGPEWEPLEEGFHCLKQLVIEKTDLVHWKATSIHFPSLQRLVLRSCNNLKEIPFSVGEIPTLEIMELQYCSKSAEISAEEIKEQIEAVDVHIQSNYYDENHLKRTLSYDSCSLMSRKNKMRKSPIH